MEVNATPLYDKTDNPTGCCPRFKPEPWEDQALVFADKPFVRTSTVSLFHIPLNVGSMYRKTFAAIAQAHADTGGFLVLTQDESPWHAEHLFAVDKDVPGADMVRLSGTFVTKVFEGPYAEAKTWCGEMARVVQHKGKHLDALYFFYTTCPRCAKAYGRNYVVGVARVS